MIKYIKNKYNKLNNDSKNTSILNIDKSNKKYLKLSKINNNILKMSNKKLECGNSNDEIDDEVNIEKINKGYLILIIGCMFSGKTSYIIRKCNKWKNIGKSVLIINNKLDSINNKEKNFLFNHDNIKIPCLSIMKLTSEINNIINDYDIIIINEAQFFSDLKQYLRHWCDVMNKIVYISGLDGDYLRNKFGNLIDIIPDCDKVIKLTAFCSLCNNGNPAIFTWKTSKNNNIIDIGYKQYIPLCRYHYNIENNI